MVNGILYGLIALFLIRLYVTHDQFARLINRLFTHIENSFFKFKTHCSGNIKSLIIPICGMVLIIAVIVFVGGYDPTTALALTALVMIPGIPFYYSAAEYQQQTDFDRFIDSIRTGSMSKTQFFRVKQAIKEFYAYQYAPKPPRGNQPALLDQLIKFIAHLVVPKSWPPVIIPQLTAIPIFSSFFYDSPYHARFNQYKTIIDYINDKADVHPFRLRPSHITLNESFMIIEFHPATKHALNRLTKLARTMEKDHHLTDGAIMVQETVDQYKLFIPAEILTTDI